MASSGRLRIHYVLVSCCVFLTLYDNEHHGCSANLNFQQNQNQFKRENYHERQTEVLDQDGKVTVGWEVDFETKTVIFDLTAETRGFVGFGLNAGGGMTGADIIIGGVYSNGTTYFKDYFGVGNTAPKVDDNQDWILLGAFESATHTMLRFSRLFDTCDNEDVPITSQTLNLIWAYGPEDGINYHFDNRGTLAVNILDPPYPKLDISKYDKFGLTVDMFMPSKSYTYWCTIHKAPKLAIKTHVVGFQPLMKSPDAVRHTHHFVVYRCSVPPDITAKELYDKFADVAGDDCYTAEAMEKRPTQFCDTVLYVWGAGGKDFFLPEHVGYPFGEEKDEYYMLEIHYDNPHELSNVRFETGVELLYTTKLREHEAATMTVGHTVLASLVIPPKSEEFMIVGHCSSNCTSEGLPKEGINVFNLLLHTHLAGRKMKLRHFRNNTELPWIADDDSYHFNYQKNRPLKEERKVLPGDHLTFECKYNTMSKSNVTIAGYSTRDEMCETFIWYYPKSNLRMCSSFYPIGFLYKKFGIGEVEWNKDPGLEKGTQPIIKSPPKMANKTFAQAIDATVDWTPELRKDLQESLHFADHLTSCPQIPPPSQSAETNFVEREPPRAPPLTGYPKVAEVYQPINDCSRYRNYPRD